MKEELITAFILQSNDLKWFEEEIVDLLQFPLEANFFRQDRVDAEICHLIKRYNQFGQS